MSATRWPGWSRSTVQRLLALEPGIVDRFCAEVADIARAVGHSFRLAASERDRVRSRVLDLLMRDDMAKIRNCARPWALRALLCRIVRHEAWREAHRSLRLRMESDLGNIQAPFRLDDFPASERPAEESRPSLEAREIEAMLAGQLSLRQFQVLRCRCVLGWSWRRLAEDLRLTVDGAKNVYQAGLAALSRHRRPARARRSVKTEPATPPPPARG